MDLSWEAAYGTGYQIQVSDTGTSWTRIYTKTTGKGGNESLTVNGAGRYVRMQGVDQSHRLRLLALGVPGLRDGRPAGEAEADQCRHL